MSARRLIDIMAAAGELATVADVDVILRDLRGSANKDKTWAELVDALLDLRAERAVSAAVSEIVGTVA